MSAPQRRAAPNSPRSLVEPTPLSCGGIRWTDSVTGTCTFGMNVCAPRLLASRISTLDLWPANVREIDPAPLATAAAPSPGGGKQKTPDLERPGVFLRVREPKAGDGKVRAITQ